MGSTADMARLGMRMRRKAICDCSAVGMGCGSISSSNRISRLAGAAGGALALRHFFTRKPSIHVDDN
jgi:hypothetical protein